MTNEFQIRAARSMLQISIRELGWLSEIAPNTIVRVEKGRGVTTSTLAALTTTIENFGVTFIEDLGVAFNKGKATPKNIEMRIKSLYFSLMTTAYELSPEEAADISRKFYSFSLWKIRKEEAKNELVELQRFSRRIIFSHIIEDFGYPHLLSKRLKQSSYLESSPPPPFPESIPPQPI